MTNLGGEWGEARRVKGAKETTEGAVACEVKRLRRDTGPGARGTRDI